MEASNRMTEGPIAGKIIRFAWPLFLGNLFQQLYNIADTLIVGNLLGNKALAAVSSTGALVFLFVSVFSGVSMGAGVVISRYFGAKDVIKMRLAVHTALCFAFVSGIILSIAGVLLSPQILIWMDTDPGVMVQSVAYLRVIFSGSLATALFNACMGIMQAVGDSKHPLQYLIISSCVNVTLDIIFIAVFHADVGGAAMATVIAQFTSVILCLIRLFRINESYNIKLNELRFNKDMLILILRYGLPSGFQNSIIAIANVVVQSNINHFGEMAMSGCGAYSRIEGFGFLPITSFTMALTTFVGQNLGAKEYERTKTGVRIGLFWCIVISEVIGIITFIGAPLFIRAFTSEPLAIGFGVQKARIVSPFFCFLAATHGLSAVLRGAGKAKVPMVTMLMFWCILRVSFLTIMTPIVGTIDVVNWVYPLTWFCSTVFLFIYFKRADWIHGFEKEA